MLAREIDVYVRSVKKRLGIRKYMPAKYFSGLKTKKAIRDRIDAIITGRFDASDATPNVPKRRSVYTQTYEKVYNKNENVSKATGIPKHILDAVYARGLAAWKSGHRVGATPQQWGHARQKSFAVRGCTWYGPDHDLAVRAMKKMAPKDVRRWTSSFKHGCAKYAPDCCGASPQKHTWCTDRTTSKIFKLPRKFSKAVCTRGPVRGFTMRASCAPYRGCN